MTILVLGPNGSGKSAFAEELVTRLRLPAGDIYYIATMLPYGEEGRTRVEKHRKQRKDMGFITLEQPANVSEVIIKPESAVLLEDASNLLGNVLFAGTRDGSATHKEERDGSAERVFAGARDGDAAFTDERDANAKLAAECDANAIAEAERDGSAERMRDGSAERMRDANAILAVERVFADITALCEKCRAAVLVSIGGLTELPEYDEETRGYIGALNRLNDTLADYADVVIAMRGGTPVYVKGDANALD